MTAFDDRAPSQSAVSGGVIRGVTNAASLATQQLDTLKYSRRCSIAIANTSLYTLTNPRTYVSRGKIVSIPLKIPPGHTGLIGCYKTFGWTTGTSGVVSYELSGMKKSGNRFLQIMWSVPYVGNNTVNVSVGNSPASSQVFWRLHNGSMGYLFEAKETSVSNAFGDDPQLRVDTFMGTNSFAVLVIQLENIMSKGDKSFVGRSIVLSPNEQCPTPVTPK